MDMNATHTSQYLKKPSIIMEKGSYEWYIDDVLKYSAFYSRSPYFKVSRGETCKWYMTLEFSSFNLQPDTEVKINLHLEESYFDQVYVWYNICVNEPENMKYQSAVMSPGLCVTHVLKNEKFIKPKENKMKENKVKANKGTNVVRAFIVEESTQLSPLSDMQCKLGLDIYHALENQMYTDASLTSVDYFEFSVHRSVIAARSPLFRGYFKQTGLKREQPVSVKFTSKEARKILRFLYTGLVDLKEEELIWELLKVADYYVVPSLADYCESLLLKSISPMNADDYFSRAIKGKFSGFARKIANYGAANNLELLTVRKHVEAGTIGNLLNFLNND